MLITGGVFSIGTFIIKLANGSLCMYVIIVMLLELQRFKGINKAKLYYPSYLQYQGIGFLSPGGFLSYRVISYCISVSLLKTLHSD